MAVTLALEQRDLGRGRTALAKDDCGLSRLLSTGGPCLPTLIKDLDRVIKMRKRVVHEESGQKGGRDVVGVHREGRKIVFT